MNDLDIFTIADIWRGTPAEDHTGPKRSRPQLDRLEQEWNRRLKRNSIMLIPGGFSWNRGEDLLEDLAWLDGLNGFKVMMPADQEQWGSQKDATALMQPFASLLPLVNDAVRLPGTNRHNPHTVVAPMNGLCLVDYHGDELEDRIKKSEKDLDSALRAAKSVWKNRDALIILSRYSPFSHYQNPSSLVSKMDEAKVSSCVYAGMYHPHQWEQTWQGRSGKAQFTAPDYRLATADFLDFIPTRVGTIDHAGWLRKDKERVSEIAWNFIHSPNAVARPFASLDIEYAPERPEILFSSQLEKAAEELGGKMQSAADPPIEQADQPDLDKKSPGRREKLVIVLAALPQTLTLADMEQRYGVTYQNWEQELGKFPRSTPLSHVTDCLRASAASIATGRQAAAEASKEESSHTAASPEKDERMDGDGDDEEEWLETLWLIDGNLTIKQLKKQQNDVYRKFKHRLSAFAKHITMEEVLDQELENGMDVEDMDAAAMVAAATMMSFGFGQSPAAVHTNKKKPEIDLAAAEYAITGLESGKLTAAAFELRLARIVQEQLDPQ